MKETKIFIVDNEDLAMIMTIISGVKYYTYENEKFGFNKNQINNINKIYGQSKQIQEMYQNK